MRIEDEDAEAVAEVLRSGCLSMGPRTEAFEREFAEHLGIEHVAMATTTIQSRSMPHPRAFAGAPDPTAVARPRLCFNSPFPCRR